MSAYKEHPTQRRYAIAIVVFLIFSAAVRSAFASPQAPADWHATPPVIEVPMNPSPSIEPDGALSPPFSPAEVCGAYGITALTSSLPNPTGAGVTIAIVDAYGDMTSSNSNLTDIIQSDLQTFCTKYSLPYTASGSSATLTEEFPDGAPTTTNANWATETALDVEWVHAVAPGAKILLFVSPDSGQGLYDCVSSANSLASVVSMSWGGSEFSGENTLDSTYFAQPNVAYFVATGDNGEGTEYPSVSPDVTAVGGTSLTIDSGDVYGSETAWSGSGGGTSTNEGSAAFQDPWVTSGNREVPDVSIVADPNTGVFVEQNGTGHQIGGTSLATPVWAAITGIIDANVLTPLSESNVHAFQYNFGNPTNIDTYFHDITSGSNGISAGTGYDEVTGIGTPKGNVLLPAVVPLAPSTVGATGGNAEVTVTWSTSTNATSYNVYRGTSAGGESSTPIATGLTGTQYTDTSVTNGDTYYYKVAAVNAYCTSLLSSETSAEPGSTGSASYLGSDTTTEGNWKGVYGATGWNVFGDTSAGNPTYPSGAIVTSSSPLAGIWMSSSLLPAALQVSAAASANRIAGVWYQTNWSMTVDVTSSTNIHLYLLDIDNLGVAETITLTDKNGNQLDTRSASGFSGGVYYSWTIDGPVTFTFTSTAGHWAVLSGIFFGGTGSTAPAQPTGLSGSAVSTQVALSWTASTGATSYNVYRGTTAGGESTTPLVTGLTGTGYTNTGLTNGKTYYYKVVAVNAVGGSFASAEASATPTAPTVSFVKTDTSTQGNWKGVYGADGWNVMGDTSSNNPTNPSYATVAPGSHLAGVWEATSLSPAALQVAAAGSTARIAGVWYQTSWSTQVNVTGTHQLALYLLDINNDGFAETITITDSVSGAVLNTQSASSFAGGVYYVWNVSGNVTITFTSTAGHWAVLNGIFFGGTGSTAPTVPSLSATSESVEAALAWTASTGATSYNLYRGTTAGGESTTPLVTGLTGTSYTNTGLTNGKTYYYKVVAVNAVGGSLPSNEASATPVAATAAFVKTDTSTQGNWKGVYGADGWNVMGDTSLNNPTYPSYATVAPGSHLAGVWEATSTSPAALQVAAAASTARIAGVWYQTSWSTQVNVTGTHQLALYLLDINNDGFAETVTITDSDTGAVLNTQSASSFVNGVYYVWDVSGNVTITFTSTAGHWAVLSGIFFG